MKQLFITGLLLFAASSTVQAANVIASIKPIQLITQEIMGESGKPEVLLAANTSPHDYAMRPSDVKRVRSADLVVWFGKDLEPFLSKLLSEQVNALTLSDIEGLELREYAGDHHDHDGHDHGSYDPHFWLGYKPTLQVARAIAERLSQIDSANSTVYQANLVAFETKLAKQHQDLQAQLAPVKDVGYYVFHDAYGYFEQDYSLSQIGYFTVSPDRKPGAKTLIAIRKALAASQAKCVFSEPQFTPAVIQSVVRGSDAKIGELDPIGMDVEVKVGSYFTFKQEMADNVLDCLN